MRVQEKRVLVFGSFDPLHDGHRNFFSQAKAAGTWLTVVVARDSYLVHHKGRPPHEHEVRRLSAVARCSEVDDVLLGQPWPNREPYYLLRVLAYDVVALGYDQQPQDHVVQRLLHELGKHTVELRRCQSYYPARFKSSLVRSGGEVI